MRDTNILEATFRIVTPLFLGGAKPNDRAELREASIKGALRFWYRAVDPNYRDLEAPIFGGTRKGEGQAIFLLQMLFRQRTSATPWDKKRYNDATFNEQHEGYTSRLPHSSSDSGTWRINGLQYLSYSLNFPPNDRRAIPAGQEFRLRLAFKKQPSTENKKRIIAALWLLGHLGGLGTRSRRGFGTVALKRWNITQGTVWTELNGLPIAHEAGSVEDWMTIFSTGLDTLRQWFPGPRTADHSILGANTRFHLFDSGCADSRDFKGWERALHAAGKVMQRFRQRWNLSDPNSDYFTVKAHLCEKDAETRNTVNGISFGRHTALAAAPSRAAFGLPLVFRYSSLSYLEINVKGKEHSRSASPIHVRVVQICRAYHPFYVWLDASLLPAGEDVAIKVGNRTDHAPVHATTILDDFWATLPPGQTALW